MGVTINHKLGQRKALVPKTLDLAETVAIEIKKHQASKIGVSVEIRRVDNYTLMVDIGKCETLSFQFKSVRKINKEAEQGWSYDYAVLTDDGKRPLDEGYEIETYPKNEMYYCADFCKTQFSEKMVEHKWVAEIIRVVASRCKYAEVNDEGDYYYSANLKDAESAIKENGAIINRVSDTLKNEGWNGVN